VFLLKVMKDEALRSSEIIFNFLSPDDLTNRKSSESHQNDLFKWISSEKTLNSDSSDDEELFVFHLFIFSSLIHLLFSSKDSVASQAYLLISEIFELTGFFRFIRHSIVMFVRIAFGRSIDRQLREMCQWMTSQKMICFYMTSFLQSFWPDGKLSQTDESHRTPEEKEKTRNELKMKILNNIPEVISTMLGHENTRRGFLKIFFSLQDKRLNKHLIFVSF